MDSIYSAAAFIYADALTLVASGADIHACAAAMQPALSLTTAWAAEHSLKINVAKSEAALFYISSHTHCLARTWSISILLAGTSVFIPAQCACWTQRLIAFLILARTPPPLQSRPCHAAIGCGWVQRLGHPSTPRDPFWLGASTVRCTTATRQSHRVRHPFTSTAWKCGTATAVKHLFSLAHQRKIHPSAWNPIFSRSKRYSGFLHSHNTNAIYASMITRICVPLSTGNICRRPCMKSGEINPASEDAVINGLRRVCNIIGTPHSHNRAPPIQHRIFLGHCALQ
ncbi:hypothetical protein C3747_30g74 [Trypanosoma cruzi]|uniref:Uncharacterized protein n=1 Tax=Trypanosoma cruzi TaxID=5693 RepID=A0A2V2X5N6_TRYCR|nr:hypothetical protein C3747_30g74 [Trypanosoma cruzi]